MRFIRLKSKPAVTNNSGTDLEERKKKRPFHLVNNVKKKRYLQLSS